MIPPNARVVENVEYVTLQTIYIMKCVLADLEKQMRVDYRPGELAEQIPWAKKSETFERALGNLRKAAGRNNWCTTVLDPSTFDPITRFIQPNMKQITGTLWELDNV